MCCLLAHIQMRDEYKGEVIYKSWRNTVDRLWRLSLDPDAANRITPHTNPCEYDGTKGISMNADVDIKWNINTIYECENTKQFMKYYHSSLGSHPKRMLAAAIKQGHIKDVKGLLRNMQQRPSTYAPCQKACGPRPHK